MGRHNAALGPEDERTTPSPVVLRGHEGWVVALGISPDDHWLVTGSTDKTARLWDLTAKDPATSPVVLRGHENDVSAVSFSPDNHWLVTGSETRQRVCGT